MLSRLGCDAELDVEDGAFLNVRTKTYTYKQPPIVVVLAYNIYVYSASSALFLVNIL